MDFFCKNDSYWNKIESATENIIPTALKPEAAKHRMTDGDPESLIKQWGTYDFKFKFQPQGGPIETQMSNSKVGRGVGSSNHLQRSLFQASILNAEAEEPNNPGFKVPIKCTWYRNKGALQEQIHEISSNVYQLSAKDLGCIIRVEATPLDPDFTGKAIGEFGPVSLDVSARQHLEHILGAGGSQFSVSVIMNDGGSSFEVKEECQDAILYINSNVLKISLKEEMKRDNRQKMGQMSNPRGSKLRPDRSQTEPDVNNTISFKYTVDYPKIELHPFDTKKFSIFYNDHANDGRGGGNGSGIDYFSVNLNQ